ncbi:uncharacterized protein MAM_04561 [Metarhizium album ARSEF 1941]|uniref:Uncharacterized protein n=1 Tax=Metarhizium album (strain ARSEF 1941) TaxID=1081103 RepID=A0A0B2WNA8_METAS|nr:uncharacterized protein MAM_04561 [Metarhizium album ARSEF 1941]KHN97546.1 hypothetical protein MAM_04561 [Metarhizium album ARSEF 1941]
MSIEDTSLSGASSSHAVSSDDLMPMQIPGLNDALSWHTPPFTLDVDVSNSNIADAKHAGSDRLRSVAFFESSVMDPVLRSDDGPLDMSEPPPSSLRSEADSCRTLQLVALVKHVFAGSSKCRARRTPSRSGCPPPPPAYPP